MYVFTLSTIPSRFIHLERTFETIFAQSQRPEEITLYLPRRYRRFPDYDGTLPRVPKGVRIQQVDEDLGPATKFIYACDALRGQNIDVLFGDDDCLYHHTLARGLLRARAEHPEAVIACRGYNLTDVGLTQGTRLPRAVQEDNGRDLRFRLERLKRRIVGPPRGVPKDQKPARAVCASAGFVDIFQGFAGVLVRPDFFRPEDLEIPEEVLFMDDIWFSGLLEARGIPIWIARSARIYWQRKEHLPDALAEAVLDGATRQDINQRAVNYVIRRFGIWGGKPEAVAGGH